MPTLEFLVSVDTATGVAALKGFESSVGDAGDAAAKSSEQFKAAGETFSGAGDAAKQSGEQFEDAGEALGDTGEAAQKSGGQFKIAGLSLTDMNSAVALAKQGLETLKKVWEFGRQGAENARIAQSFESTAASVGVSADAMAAALDRAAKGTVDDEAYMMAATRNMALGVATSVQDNVAIMEMARASALKFGGDTETAFTGISEAIGNLQTRQLKQYGLVIDAKKVNEEYAVAIGKTVDQLTEAEQREALRNEVLKKSKELVGEAGNAELTRAEKMKRFEIQLANVEDQAKEYVVDGLMPLLDRGAAVNVLADESATAQDRLAAAYTLADGKIGGRNGIYDDLILRYQEEVRLQELATSGAYGQAGALDESSRAAQRAAESQARLTAAQQAAISGAYGINGALDESARAAQRASDAAANAAAATAAQQQAAITAAAAQAEYTRGMTEAATAAGVTAQKLKDVTDAQAKQMLAQASLDTLKKAREEGTITEQGYQRAIDATLLSYDLATPKSIAMAEAQRKVNEAFLAGDLPLNNFITASGKIPTIAGDGKVTMEELANLGIKAVNTALADYSQTRLPAATAASDTAKSHLDIMRGSLDNSATALDVAAKNAVIFKRELDKLHDMTFTITTNYVTNGTPPPIGGSGTAQANSRALGGPVDEGWWYLHDDEYVLSKAMREGRQAIPAEAAPLRQVVGANVSYGGDTVIINDQAALGMYLNAKRLDQLQQIAGILG